MWILDFGFWILDFWIAAISPRLRAVGLKPLASRAKLACVGCLHDGTNPRNSVSGSLKIP
jgi:hypothetical protein